MKWQYKQLILLVEPHQSQNQLTLPLEGKSMLTSHKKLVYQEDFTKEKLNDSVWQFEVGEKWFNNEKQCYVQKPKNLLFDSQGMHLVADVNPEENRCRYQSIRINTKGKKDWQYGTFIIRAKIPNGQGSWPAIWFLPTDIGNVRWPQCGEIDLMEHVGHDPEVIHFSLHSQKYNHIIKTQITSFHKITNVRDAYHDYKMVWRKEGLSFFVDDLHYVTFASRAEEGQLSWPFDKPYYLILNLAVGGFWGGEINESHMPFRLSIHSLKVYQE
jgi:beta-glucanase (GH16 family)